MKQRRVQEKYPIAVVDIDKTGTTHTTVDALAERVKACIADTPRVSVIAPGIQAAVNVVLCFGHA